MAGLLVYDKNNRKDLINTVDRYIYIMAFFFQKKTFRRYKAPVRLQIFFHQKKYLEKYSGQGKIFYPSSIINSEKSKNWIKSPQHFNDICID